MLKIVTSDEGAAALYEFVIPDSAQELRDRLKPGSRIAIYAPVNRVIATGGYGRSGQSVTPRLAFTLDNAETSARILERLESAGPRVSHVSYDGGGDWVDLSFSTGTKYRLEATRLHELALETGEKL